MSVVREMHGLSDDRVRVAEYTTVVVLRTVGSEKLTPHEARYIAAKLIRLANRVEDRIARTLPAAPADGGVA